MRQMPDDRNSRTNRSKGIGSSGCVLARRPRIDVMVSPVRTPRRVHEALLGVPGVTAARVDLKTQEAEVIADTPRVTAAELIRAVNDADFGAVLKGSS